LVRVSRRVGKDHFDRIAQSTLGPRGRDEAFLVTDAMDWIAGH